MPPCDAERRATAYERGGYCVGGVVDFVEQADAATATVVSSSDRQVEYRVRLYQSGGESAGTCDCPQGLEGRFCKHCVAVGLRLIGGASPAARPRASRPGTSPSPGAEQQVQAVEAFLASSRPEELAGLLRDAARDDPAFRRRLWLLTAASEPAQPRARTKRLRRGYRIGQGADYPERARAVVFALSHRPAAQADTAHELLPLVLQYLLNAVDTDVNEDSADEYSPDDDPPVLGMVEVAWRAYPPRRCHCAPDPRLGLIDRRSWD